VQFTVNTETDRTATAPIDVHSDRAFADDAGDIGEASA